VLGHNDRVTANPETETATIPEVKASWLRQRPVKAAQNPLERQLRKCLNLRGRKIRGSAAHKDDFVAVPALGPSRESQCSCGTVELTIAVHNIKDHL
jgi:hypothetical protein